MSDDDDDEYDGGYDEPVVVTASGDHHHGEAFVDDDDGFTEDLPHVGLVHGNGDGSCFTDSGYRTGCLNASKFVSSLTFSYKF